MESSLGPISTIPAAIRQLQEELSSSTDPRFDLLGKLFQHSVQEMLSSVGPDSFPTGPYVVEIDPTTACNLSCPECISGSLLNQGYLPESALLSLIEDLAEMGTRAVIFIGGGEPMAHPRFSELVRHAAGRGIEVGITTNGTLIRRHLEAVAEHASWTRVSIDAGTRETFAHFRPSVRNRLPLDTVVEQMRELAAVKSGSLGYSFLVLKRDGRTNIDEIVVAAELARDVGCDYIEIKPSMGFDHRLVRWEEEELDAILTGLDEARALETSSFHVLAPITLFHAMHAGDRLDQPKDYDWCPAARYRTVVSPSGCYVCPYHRGNPRMRYGHLGAGSFKEIWTSGRARSTIGAVDPSADCGFHCIRHAQNVHLTGDGLEEAPVVDDFDPFV